MAQRYVAEWSGYPRGPWVVRDRETGKAFAKPGSGHFWHGEFEAATWLADRLNEQASR